MGPLNSHKISVTRFSLVVRLLQALNLERFAFVLQDIKKNGMEAAMKYYQVFILWSCHLWSRVGPSVGGSVIIKASQKGRNQGGFLMFLGEAFWGCQRARQSLKTMHPWFDVVLPTPWGQRGQRRLQVSDLCSKASLVHEREVISSVPPPLL